MVSRIINPATAISLDKSSISLTTVWQTEQITATLTPADTTSTVSWSSSDTTVATVDNTWLVTCVTPWECTITATTSNGLTATCEVAQWWLPSTYQEVEYIENTSSWPRIDLWCKATSNTKSIIKFRNLAATGGVIYWTEAGNDNADYRLFNYSNRLYFDLNSSRISWWWSSLVAGVDYEWELWNFYVKDYNTQATIVSGSAIASYTSATNMTLNQQTWGSSLNRWYYVKVYENDVLIRDLVPCYRIADTVIWMYDLENWTFYTNSGSGTFTKWPDV